MSSHKFEHLSHVSDAFIAAYGRTLLEAFENAALSVTETMTDPTTISEELKDAISVTGHDEKALLYNWLEQLLLNFDIDGKIYSRFRVNTIERRNGFWNLTAEAYGEKFVSGKHPSRTEIKAVTYHQMDIRKKEGKYVLKFILDL